MKKLVHYFMFIVLFSIFLPIRSVFATDPCDIGNSSDINYKISYDVTSFTIADDDVNFRGWAFLDHMDNYGGINMNTYIAAYTGDWNDNWNSDITKCNNSKNCYALKTNVEARDLYFLRCTTDACSVSNRDKIISELENNSRNARAYSDASCISNGNYSGSHCAYHNVGFSLTMKISNIEQKFGNDSTVKFRIITQARYGKNRKNINRGTKRSDSVDIGVFPNSNCTVFGASCDDNQKKYTTTYKSSSTINGITVQEKKKRTVTLDGLSKKVLFTAVRASGSTNSTYSQIRGTCFYPNSVYDLKSVESEKWWNNWKGNRDGKVKARLLKLYGKNDSDSGYAWSAWVRATGTLKLTLKDESDNTCTGCTCADEAIVACVGSKCTIDSSTSCPNSTNVSKLETQNGTADHSTCSSVNNLTVSSSEQAEQVYWLNIPRSEIDEKLVNQGVNYVTSANYARGANITNKLVLDGTTYWFPIKLKALVKFTQTFNLNLNFVSSKVDSGGSFPFSFDYSTSVSSSAYPYDVSNGTSKYNTYQATYRFEVIDSSGVKSYKNIAIGLTSGDEIFRSLYWLAPSKTTYSADLFNSIANSVSQKDLNNSERNAKVTFPDTNKPSVSKEDAGDFTCSSSSECSYILRQAYVSKDGSGKVQYSQTEVSGFDKLQSQGSRYVVSPLWKTGDKFEFRINARFGFSNTKLNYNATCSLDTVTNKIHSTNYVKYRSIDTSNPFPDSSKIPENWKEFQKIDSNFSRIINNSFNTVNYQTGFFGSSIKNTLKELENSNKIGSYSSYKDVTSSGSDKLITDTDIFSVKSGISGQNYCLTGQFNENCNKLLVS